MLELKISQGGTETHYGQINKSIILKLKKKKKTKYTSYGSPTADVPRGRVEVMET